VIWRNELPARIIDRRRRAALELPDLAVRRSARHAARFSDLRLDHTGAGRSASRCCRRTDQRLAAGLLADVGYLKVIVETILQATIAGRSTQQPSANDSATDARDRRRSSFDIDDEGRQRCLTPVTVRPPRS